jgi:hypothetical protein
MLLQQTAVNPTPHHYTLQIHMLVTENPWFCTMMKRDPLMGLVLVSQPGKTIMARAACVRWDDITLCPVDRRR